MNFNEMFRKNVTYGSFKSHKKNQSFTLFLENKKGGKGGVKLASSALPHPLKG